MRLTHLESIRLYELETAISILTRLPLEKKNLSILEIGAGTGWQAKALTEHGYSVEAIDIEKSNYAKDQVWPIKHYDGKNIPFAKEHFDIVFSSNVMEHIHNLESFHFEMQRILKPGGYAIHIVPSGGWRFWTSLTHYPSVLQKIFKIVFRLKGANTQKLKPSTQPRTVSGLTKLKNISFPIRHGETGNSISELYYFSEHYWRKVFLKGQWDIVHVLPNRLFYTGYSIFDASLGIQTRKCLSYFLGSSCHIFVLAKKEG